MQSILTGLVLSASSGLSAFLPLLVLSLLDLASDKISLIRPYEVLSSPGGIAVLVILVTLEIFVDKIPALRPIADVLGYVVCPATAALCFMAVTWSDDSMNIVLAMMLGLLIGGAVYALTAQRRVEIDRATRGAANPLLSMAEDGAAVVLSVLAILLPVAGAIAAVLVFIGFWWLYRSIPGMGIWTPPPTAIRTGAGNDAEG